MKIILRREILLLALLFLFALGLRLLYLEELRHSPLFDDPIVDAQYYDEWAQSIGRDWLQASQPYRPGPFFRAPLYAYFLALISLVFGHSYLWWRIVQFAIGSASVVLIYYLGKKVFDRTVGAVAAVMAAGYGTFIFFEGELLDPALTILLDLVLVLAVLAAAQRSGWWRWLGCGALLGLSAIARPSVLIFPGVLVPWMWLRLRRRGLSRGGVGQQVLAVLIGTTLMVAPVAVRNILIGNDFVPIASQGGVNFYIGNNPQADGFSAILPDEKGALLRGRWDAVALAQKALGRPLKASQVSDYWFRRGLGFIRDEPLAFGRLWLKKLALFWTGTEISNNQDIYFFSSRTWLLRQLLWSRSPLACPFGLVAPLALAGMVLAWKRKEGSSGLVVLFAFSYMAGVVAFFVTDRYRLPVVPFLLPFAAYSLVSVFRPRGLRRVLLPLGLILAFGLAMILGLPAGPRVHPAESHATLGEAYLRKGISSPAEEEFRQALSIAPSYYRAMIGLARALSETGRNDEAIGWWRQAISLRPEMAELHFQMGFPLYAAGRLDEAIAAWQEAARIEPQLAQPHFQLGLAYEDQGRYDQAIDAYRQALEANPSYVLANYNLAHLYVRLGRAEEAVAEFKKAIAANPRFGDAYNSLAWLYAQEGMNLDEGIELANKALELDPESGAYWDTLAELYIKKGAMDKAREILHRMIQKEPDNSFWKGRLKELEK